MISKIAHFLWTECFHQKLQIAACFKKLGSASAARVKSWHRLSLWRKGELGRNAQYRNVQILSRSSIFNTQIWAGWINYWEISGWIGEERGKRMQAREGRPNMFTSLPNLHPRQRKILNKAQLEQLLTVTFNMGRLWTISLKTSWDTTTRSRDSVWMTADPPSWRIL